jgi:lactoylglutathione lyase
MPVAQLTVSNVRLLVRDFAASFRFYHEQLGVPVRLGDGAGPYGELGNARQWFGMFEAALMAEAVGAPKDEARSGLPFAVILETPDVDLLYARLQADGLPILTPPTDRPAWGLRTIHLRDPDGNLVELYHDLPRRPAPRRPKKGAGRARRRPRRN